MTMPTVGALQELIEGLLAERDHRYEQRFVQAEVAREAALAAVKTANAKAEEDAKLWRASANEWRGAMGDRERSFVSRTEAASENRRMAEKIDELTARITRTEGQTQGAASTTALLLSVAGVLVTVVGGVIAILALNA
jgi:hypothetical protein